MDSATPVPVPSLAVSLLGAFCFGVLGAFLSAIAPFPGLFEGASTNNLLALMALAGAAATSPIAAAIGGCVAFCGFFFGYRRLWLRWKLLLLVPAIFASVPYLLFEPGIGHLQ